MQPSPRRTRQRTREKLKETSVATPIPAAEATIVSSLRIRQTIPRSPTLAASLAVKPLPTILTTKATGLSAHNLKILRAKQTWLQSYTIQLPGGKPSSLLSAAVSATLVFAQEEAGTAVCVSPQGVLLTCSHCVAESEAGFAEPRVKTKWLLFSSGQLVKAECVAWDCKRDLALLKIVAAETSTSFPYVSLALKAPVFGAQLACIGHPGSEDLEASTAGIRTGYDVLHVSTGSIHGHDPDQDVQDNSDIGALKHDCWTYWGHSGAPLLDRRKGGLVGLHSSWDDETGMRRAVAWEAIEAFLEEWKVFFEVEGVEEMKN